jgi:hypothetical protein
MKVVLSVAFSMALMLLPMAAAADIGMYPSKPVAADVVEVAYTDPYDNDFPLIGYVSIPEGAGDDDEGASSPAAQVPGVVIVVRTFVVVDGRLVSLGGAFGGLSSIDCFLFHSLIGPMWTITRRFVPRLSTSSLAGLVLLPIFMAPTLVI